MRSRGRRLLFASLAVAALLLTAGGPFAPWMALAIAQTRQPTAPDAPWPRRFQAPDGSIVVIYEPQIATWENQKKMTLFAAVTHTPKGAEKPLVGTVQVEANTRVSVSERLVDFSSFQVVQSHFQDASKEQVAAAVEAVKAMPMTERVIALDRVLAYYDASSIRITNTDGLKADPPVIFSSMNPAVIVNIDGAPVWSPIDKVDLRYVVNTNWDLFEHGPTKTYYLRNGNSWLKSSTLATGAWTAAGTLPASFSKLPADENWKEVKAAVPGQAVAAASLPRVFVSEAPAELILFRGAPLYAPVPGTQLQWVRNTDSDVFRVGTTGPVYFLVSGRWFSSPGFDGPWTFATTSLPADFKKIPLEHERSRVLASVPGTPQAAEAVVLAQIPQTARVNKKQIQPPDVAYAGDPKFEPIPQTSVARAVNTDKDIIKVGDLYYMCFQGVWFMSRSATGPWQATGTVPKEIYTIPVSSPSHNVTYVTVEDDDDEWVTYATAAAYGGMMVAWGCAVWGSGWYYPPYVWYGGFYPAYFPYYPTYGYSAWYNPWTGAYGRSYGVYGPYGGAGVGARYNPRTGTYARGAAAYGPYGARGYAEAYNPRTGTRAATRQASGVYGSWGSTAVQRGDQWATTTRRTNNITDTTTRRTETSGGGSAVSRRGPDGGGFVGQSGSGDVYAGRDGNVYRNQGGTWQKYENGSWNNAQGPANQPAARSGTATDRGTTSRSDPATINQLDRDAAARRDGSQRTNDATSIRGGTTRSGTGSYRPSGGSAGGGARRAGGGGRRR